MTIRLTKGRGDKPPVLTCIRDDGSVTYQASSEFFARHDLLHYTVETTLGYRHAFLGLVAAGRDIADFGTRNGVRDTYTNEEIWTEHVIGILQWSLVGADDVPTDAELITRLRETCTHQGTVPPPVTPAQMRTIRDQARDLHRQWDAREAGASLELVF